MREKIVELLLQELSYAYCYNCKGSDEEIDHDRFCDDCHRKYQNWALSKTTAGYLADEIIKMFEEEKING